MLLTLWTHLSGEFDTSGSGDGSDGEILADD
jgi:hypothetical protein